MTEYIKREDVLKILSEKNAPWNGYIKCKELPADDVQPVKHGTNLKAEWPSLFECSICHWSCWDTYCGDTAEYNYCPNCGAKMEEQNVRKSNKG